MIWTHVSELAIDRLLAGELAPADAAAVRDHAGGCLRCGAQLDDAVAAQRTFAENRPPLAFAVAAPRRRYVAAAAGAIAFAATVAIAFAWPRSADRVRTKGSAIVGFFVAHGDQVRRGATQEIVMPGDRIELFTTAAAPGWFAAVSSDAHATRSVYLAAQPFEPGHERMLPTAIELDAALGTEIVTGVFCEATFDPLAIDLQAPPPGCTLDRFTLVKVAR